KADQMQRVAQSDSDFTLLYELEGQLEDILRDGYRVKFLTFPGLQRLLLLQVEKEADLDYTLNGFTVEGLSLTTEEAEKVETFLSKNWTLTKTGETYTIQPTILSIIGKKHESLQEFEKIIPDGSCFIIIYIYIENV